jgi:hypothetical protein
MTIAKEELVSIIIKNSRKRINLKDAEDIASTVLGIFGFNTGIADTLIDSNTRSLFNILYDLGILTVKNEPIGENIMLYIGGNRYFLDYIPYWFLEPKEIEIKKEVESKQDFYESLPDETWERY